MRTKNLLHKAQENKTPFYLSFLIFTCSFFIGIKPVFSQDTLFIYKSHVIVNKQAVEDIDSIIFYDVTNGTYTDTIYIYQGGSLVNQHALAALDSISFSKREFLPLVPVSDVDGNEYQVVKIGSQVWMTENLRTTRFNSGDPIPYGTISDTDPNYIWYDGDDMDTIRGALYNYPAVQTEDLCPTGFRIATKEDWDLLIQFVQLQGYEEDQAAYPLKTVDGWRPGDGGINEYGFSARAGGHWTDDNGSIKHYSEHGFWWTTTKLGTNFIYYIKMGRLHGITTQDIVISIDSDYSRGFSVRCIRNDSP